MTATWYDTELERRIARSQSLSTKTQRLYLARVQSFLEFGGVEEHNWTTARVEDWRDSMLERGLKPQTVNLYMAAVRFASKRRADREDGPDFARGAERAKKTATLDDKDNIKALTLNQCRVLLLEIQSRTPVDLRDRAMILVGLRLGMRREELCSLNFEHTVDSHTRFIAKGNKVRSLDIDSETWAVLSVWMDWLRSQQISSGKIFRSLRSSIDENGWNIGNSISSEGFAKILKKRGDAAGIDGLHPHMLRHTYTSLSLQSGVPEWRIRKTLGHKSNLMLDRYTTDLSETAVGEELPSFIDD